MGEPRLRNSEAVRGLPDPFRSHAGSLQRCRRLRTHELSGREPATSSVRRVVRLYAQPPACVLKIAQPKQRVAMSHRTEKHSGKVAFVVYWA